MRLMKPCGERVLIEPIKPASTTTHGIMVPEAFQDKSSDFIVVQIGASPKIEVRIGDRVIINRFSGTEVQIGDRSYKLIDNNDLLAIVE